MRRSAALLALTLTLSATAPAAAQPPEVLAIWDGYCRPLGIALDAAERVYVADQCWDRIFVTEPDGSPVMHWPTPMPFRGLAVSRDDRVYVASPTADGTQGSGVFVYSTDGTLLDTWDTNGTGPGEFYGPIGVAIDGEGLVFVTEQGNARVQVLSADGTPVRQWGARGTGPGEFSDPEGIAIGPDGLVYVTDADLQTVQVFTREGALVRAWGGTLGSAPGEFHGPRGIALDAAGNVYVADTGNHRVQVFSSAGAFLTGWGVYEDGPTAAPGRFRNPMSIAVTRDGHVLVGDFNARIQVFGAAPTPADRASWGSLKQRYR